MLAELRIADLGVIREAVIEPGPGFTVVTGETGAGKTMVVTGLSLLLGAKAEARMVRNGAARCVVEGRWTVGPDDLARLDDLGALAEDGEVLVARQVGSSRSRSYLGGVAVPLAASTDLVSQWVTIHGQSEQLRLATNERQRQILDRSAGEELSGQLALYGSAFAQRRRLRAELDELTGRARERARELDQLTFGLEEIARVDPQPDEDTTLRAEAHRLQAVDDLRLAAHTASVALSGEDDAFDDAANALSAVTIARKALAAAVQDDPTLEPVAGRLAEAGYLLNDVAADLSGYLAGLDADPNRLEWIAGRSAELQSLTRKYGDSIAEVLTWSRSAAERVTGLSGTDQRITELNAKLAVLDRTLADAAATITRFRTTAAGALAEAVQRELAALAMPQARLTFAVEPLDELGPLGADRVNLLFSANPGSAAAPLGRVASGGELSRVRLALEVVLASSSAGQTFVFDEVDAGVGGAVALEIGRRLARLAEHGQVIVVTHLAQVAAFADKHFVVAKADDGQVTTSGIEEVTGDDRLGELARMMAGLDESDSALAHAAELLRAAELSHTPPS